MKTETNREIAERELRALLKRHSSWLGDEFFNDGISTIEAALDARDKRAAKIADEVARKANDEWKAAYKRNDSSPMKVYNGRRLAAEEIASEIRGKD